MDDFVTWLEHQLVDAAGRDRPRRRPSIQRARQFLPLSLGRFLPLAGVAVAVAVAVLALTLPSHRRVSQSKPPVTTSKPIGTDLQTVRDALRTADAIVGWSAVTAFVTVNEPGGPFTLTVDKGSASGIRVGDPAVSDTGLVGSVAKVERTSATIYLIGSPSLAGAGVRVEDRVGTTGFLQAASGQPTGLLLYDLAPIRPGRRPHLGQLVVTVAASNGRREQQPAGIPVGIVSHTSSKLYAKGEVAVTPAADLRHLTTIKILTDPPWKSRENASPPASQLALLGVLRRPPGPLDRAYDQEALSQLGGGITGIERSYVRMLYHSDRYGSVLLIPAKSYSMGGYTFTNPLCLESVPPSGRGSGYSCGPRSELTSGHLAGSAGTLEYAVVPDRIATVVIHFHNARSRRIAVHNNVVTFTKTRLTRLGGAPEQPTSIQWLDAAGKPVPQGP